MAKPGYYAVKAGRVPGVYRTWAECEDQIKGFTGARHKKFSSLAEAESFVKETGPTSSVSHQDPVPVDKGKKRLFSSIDDESECLVVYSDGACKGNGGTGSVAGVGVWWGLDDVRNIGERCPGEQTNNRAELIAILRVLESTPISSKPLMIKTDSQYSINCFQNWIHGWVKNNWKTSSGQAVKNMGIIRCIAKYLEIRTTVGQKVHLKYVKGHSGDVGNDGADYMANEGTRRPSLPERDWTALEKDLDIQLDSILQATYRPPLIVEPEGSVSKTKFRKVDDAPSEPLKAQTPKKSDPISCDLATPQKPRKSPEGSTKPTPQSYHSYPRSPPKVTYVAPPLVPVRAENVNLDDYADCLLDACDLDKDLLD